MLLIKCKVERHGRERERRGRRISGVTAAGCAVVRTTDRPTEVRFGLCTRVTKLYFVAAITVGRRTDGRTVLTDWSEADVGIDRAVDAAQRKSRKVSYPPQHAPFHEGGGGAADSDFPTAFSSLLPSVRIGRVIHWYCSPGSGVFPV